MLRNEFSDHFRLQLLCDLNLVISVMFYFYNLLFTRNRLNKRRRKSKLRKLSADTIVADVGSVPVNDNESESSESPRRIRVTSGPRCTPTVVSVDAGGSMNESSEALRRIRVTSGPQCNPLDPVDSSAIAPVVGDGEMTEAAEDSDALRRIRIKSGPRCIDFNQFSGKATMKISVSGESRKIGVKDLPPLPPLVSSCPSAPSSNETHRRIRVTSGPLCFPVNKKQKIDHSSESLLTAPKTLKDALSQAKEKGSKTEQAKYRKCLWLISDINKGVDPSSRLEKEEIREALDKIAAEFPKELPTSEKLSVVIRGVVAHSLDGQSRPFWQEEVQIEEVLPPGEPWWDEEVEAGLFDVVDTIPEPGLSTDDPVTSEVEVSLVEEEGDSDEDSTRSCLPK